jgi:outer membrane usher protein
VANFFLLSAPAISVHAESAFDDSQLFEKVFKQKAEARSVVVPLFIAGIARDTITFYPSESLAQYAVDADKLLSAVEEFLQPRTFAALKQLRHMEEGRGVVLRFSDLEQVGLAPKYREDTLELMVQVPPTIRRTQLIDFRANTFTDSSRLHAPAKFSGYLNMYANQDYAFRDSSAGTREGRLPLLASFDTAFNIQSVVLEGSGNFQEGGATPWRRNDVRLVKDFPKDAVRVQLGDLSYRTLIFQQTRPMGGISISKNYDLQPYLLTVPTSRNEFFLKSPSELEVYVNDRLFQRMKLPAGNFDIRNLPLSTGLNHIRYAVVDESGRAESIAQPFNSDPESLRRGLHQYSYNVGVASRPLGATYRYDANRLTTSLFHRYGFSDAFTGGVSAQGDRLQYVAGGEALYASRFGTIGFDLAHSQVRNGVDDIAGRVRYLYRDFVGGRAYQRSFLLSVDSQGRRFAPLGNTAPNNAAIYNANVSYSQQIIYDIGAGIGANYTGNRNTSTINRDAYALNYTLGKSWRAGWNTSLIASHGKDSQGNSQKSIFFLLTYQFPDSGHNLAYTLNTPTRSNRLDWRYTSAKRSEQWNANAGVETSDSQKLFESQVSYVHHRGEFTLAQQAMNMTNGDRRLLAKARLAGAIAFADGKIGLSRPISDSFVIFTKPAEWPDEEIKINPDADGSYDAQINKWGPGIIPALTSYTHPRLHVDGSGLSRGLSLGNENYALAPSYKSGTHIAVGSDATVYGYGVIVDKAGVPMELGFARIIALDEPERAPIEIFTNRAGEFQAEGLKPGRFEIRELGEKAIQFTIPEGSRGMYNLGTLKGER